MRKKLFEIAIILHSTHEEDKNNIGSTLIVPPKYVMAINQESATLLAAREIPEAHLDKLDRLEVAVRPF